jgi:hypothetical protein
MNQTLNKIAALLAFGIGAMAIYASVKPLLGNNPNYNVVGWLPLYNYTMGILAIFVAAILIWVNSKLALPVAIATFSIHAVVMLVLQTAYRGFVAPDSIEAMTIRLAAWLVILALMVPQWRKKARDSRISAESPA